MSNAHIKVHVIMATQLGLDLMLEIAEAGYCAHRTVRLDPEDCAGDMIVILGPVRASEHDIRDFLASLRRSFVGPIYTIAMDEQLFKDRRRCLPIEQSPFAPYWAATAGLSAHVTHAA